MSTSRSIFVASALHKNLGGILKKALAENGYNDMFKVEELQATGAYGNFTLTDEWESRIPEIEVVLAEPSIIAQVANHPENKLKWAQSTVVGVNKFFTETKDHGKVQNFIFTRRSDVSGRMIAEFVLGRIIYRERHFDVLHDNQKRHEFPFGLNDLGWFRTLDQLDVGILGLGELGKEVARYCKFAGMTVWAALRDERYNSSEERTECDSVDHFRPVSRLEEILSSCDYLINTLPSTPRTTNMLSGDVFQACQNKGTVFINVGRGDVIDEHSLVNALRNGWLGGAILDVFNKEPLPPSSPLWTLPGVTISPHVSATIVAGKANPTDVFMHNLKCYLDGSPMKYQVDFSKGY